MPGLYDRLQGHTGGDDDSQPPAGLTPLEIAGLPEPQRTILTTLLREAKGEWANGLPLATLHDMLHGKLDDPASLPALLDDLVSRGWALVQGTPPNARYKVNLRRKRTSSLAASMWESLSEDDEDNGDDPPDDPGKKKSGFSRLLDW